MQIAIQPTAQSALAVAPAAAGDVFDLFIPVGTLKDVLRPDSTMLTRDGAFGVLPTRQEMFRGSLDDALEAARTLSTRHGSSHADAVGVFQAGDGAFQLQRLHRGTTFPAAIKVDGPDDWFAHLQATQFTTSDRSLLGIVGGRHTAMFDASGKAVIRYGA